MHHSAAESKAWRRAKGKQEEELYMLATQGTMQLYDVIRFKRYRAAKSNALTAESTHTVSLDKVLNAARSTRL